MAEVVELERKALKRLIGREIGLPPEQPRIFLGQKRAAFQEADILALPVDASQYQPLQDLTVGSATFGMSYFFPNIDNPYTIQAFQPLP